MPSTSPGSISGDAMKVAMALPAGTRPRTTAIAHSVPRVNEMHVARNATCADSHTEASSESALRMALYHRQEKPSGGNEKIVDGENETATTMTIGANRNISTKTSTAQQKPMPKRAMVSASLSARAPDRMRPP